MTVLAYGWIPEWPKGADCKSVANCFGGSNPPPPIEITKKAALGAAFFVVRQEIEIHFGINCHCRNTGTKDRLFFREIITE